MYVQRGRSTSGQVRKWTCSIPAETESQYIPGTRLVSYVVTRRYDAQL
jgi:hypothetical protein